jgi:hypothetical protein
MVYRPEFFGRVQRRRPVGMGRLNVWIHDRESPCKISDETWFVNITYCSGEILEWCGKRFGFLEAKCGHLEVEIPPGCYIVYALQLFWLPRFKFPLFLETHFAIVMVECDAAACVHLYYPTLRHITRQIGNAGNILAAEGRAEGLAKRVAEVAGSFLEHLPTTSHDEVLEQAAQEAVSRLKRKGK